MTAASNVGIVPAERGSGRRGWEGARGQQVEGREEHGGHGQGTQFRFRV